MTVLGRIDELERNVRMLVQAPTIPIFDTQNRMWPQDFDLPGQLVMDINFYNLAWTDENGSWNYGPTPDPSQVGNVPQDAVEGQIAIGSDGSLNWFIAGQWWSSSFTNSTVGNVPQDVLKGQVVIGTDGTLHWYDGTNWQTFGIPVPITNYVMKAPVGDAYAGINSIRAEHSVFPSVYDETWATARIWMSDVFVTAFTQSVGLWPDGDPSNVTLLTILGGGSDGFGLIDPAAAGGGGSWFGNDNTFAPSERGSSPAPDSGNWHIYELQTIQTAGTSKFIIDETTVWSGALDSGGGSGNTSAIWIGAMAFTPFGGESGPGNSDLTGGYVLFDYVKFGTTRGAQDIFGDDFSSGDMSNWTTHGSFIPFVILDPT